jgi:hypothetical protein
MTNAAHSATAPVAAAPLAELTAIKAKQQERGRPALCEPWMAPDGIAGPRVESRCMPRSYLTRRLILQTALVLVACGTLACGSDRPASDGLRDSFLQQLAANRFIRDAKPSADEISFTGPGVDGKERSAWRVHVDSAVVEESEDAAKPFRGVVRSSWFADGVLVRMAPGESNLPIELTSNGLAQECWALWDPSARRWSWE